MNDLYEATGIYWLSEIGHNALERHIGFIIPRNHHYWYIAPNRILGALPEELAAIQHRHEEVKHDKARKSGNFL